MRWLVLFALGAAAIVTGDRADAFMRPGASPGGNADIVAVPGATFKLGKQASWGGPNAGTNGDPEGVSVTVVAFAIDRTEVTARAYSVCASAGACPRLEDGSDQSACTSGRAGYEEHPINCVTYDEAVKYCAWAG